MGALVFGMAIVVLYLFGLVVILNGRVRRLERSVRLLNRNILIDRINRQADRLKDLTVIGDRLKDRDAKVSELAVKIGKEMQADRNRITALERR